MARINRMILPNPNCATCARLVNETIQAIFNRTKSLRRRERFSFGELFSIIVFDNIVYPVGKYIVQV